MIALIARREFTEYVRDGRLFWTGVLIVLLMLTALAVSWQQQQAIESERVAAQALDYDDWLNQGERHPHDGAHQGMHVFKPEPALSIIDPGINPFVGSTVWLQAHRQSETKFRPAQDATGLQRFGKLSPAWALQILGPLMIIVLGFNSFAGERERGTLRQTLSLGVPATRLLWGKALALGGALALLLIPMGIAAVAVGWVGVQSDGRADTVWRFAWLMLGYALYFATTIFLVLAVSARASSSRMALIVLLGLWIAGTTLAPRVASELARYAHPSPNREQFYKEMNADLSSSWEKAWKDNFGTAARWGAKVPLNQWGKGLEIDDKVGYGVFDKHFGALWDSFEEQRRAQEWPGLVFPLLALRTFSMGMAGTDFVHHREFSVAAERQRRILQDIVSQDLVQNADTLGNQHFSYEAGPEFWKKVPRFNYRPRGVVQALRSNVQSLIVLTLGCVLSALLCLTMIKRPLVSK